MDAIQQMEQIVDRYGLKSAVEALAIVCSLNAAYTAEYLHDMKTTKTWDRSARLLDALAAKVEA